MKNLSLELLAEKMNLSVWTKGDLKRIYLNDVGHNTKKMSTKAYIYEQNGQFKVSVYIDCPSQNYNWIKSQQEQVEERILDKIEDVLCDEAFIVVNSENNPVDDCGSEIKLNDVFLEQFFTKEKAEKFIEENDLENVLIKKFNREELDKEIERLDEIERKENSKKREENKVEVPTKKEVQPKVSTEMYGVGSKVKHPRFNIGEVTEEDEKNCTIVFPDVGEKKLIKKFCKLELV